MDEKLDLDRLKQEQVAKRTRWLVWLESLAILGLLIWVSLEYEYNQYLQLWAARSIGPLGFLLNGTLAGLYAGGLLGYAISTYAGKRSEAEKILESIKKKSFG
jgi:hypothetical protein